MAIDVSVVIPVYNGVKYIEKTVRGILNQTLRNIEIILVENGSSDNSFSICQRLEQRDSRVRALHSVQKGTSLARKLGVEAAKGTYIVFSDQDDAYISRTALQEMYNAIVEDGSDICQFGYYKEYLPGIRRRLDKTQTNKVIARDRDYADTIRGITGGSGSGFDTSVWSKIYTGSILKSAVTHVHAPLLYAEDMNLNLWTFFDPMVKKVSLRKEAYYVWNVSVGFSSSQQGGETLFREYDIVKPTAYYLLLENECSEDTLFLCHLESIYFFKAIVESMVAENKERDAVLEKIRWLNHFEYIKASKEFFRKQPAEKIWEELRFLSSDYSAEEYLAYCENRKPRETLKLRINKLLKRMKTR